MASRDVHRDDCRIPDALSPFTHIASDRRKKRGSRVNDPGATVGLQAIELIQSY